MHSCTEEDPVTLSAVTSYTPIAGQYPNLTARSLFIYRLPLELLYLRNSVGRALAFTMEGPGFDTRGTRLTQPQMSSSLSWGCT
jgi:hypothetical protein